MVACYMLYLPETKDPESSLIHVLCGLLFIVTFSFIAQFLNLVCVELGVLIHLFIRMIQMFPSYFYVLYEPLVLILVFCMNNQFYLLLYMLIKIS